MSEAYAELGGAVLEPVAAEPAITPEHALLLGLILQKLKRVVTQPGTGDRAFIRDLVAANPLKFSAAQREHVMRMAWRYRFSLPEMLRPARDPDLKPLPEAI